MNLSNSIAKQQNPHAKPVSANLIDESVVVMDHRGKPVTMQLVTVRFDATEDYIKSKFNVTTQTMLIADSADNRPSRLWEISILSKVDNTTEKTPSSKFKDPIDGYRKAEACNPDFTLEDNLKNMLRTCAYEHHERHKTAVVLELAGSNQYDLEAFVNSLPDRCFSEQVVME